MEDSKIERIVKEISENSIDVKQQILNRLVSDLNNNGPMPIPSRVFSELLKNETDDICKWYEIKALGDLKSIQDAKLILGVFEHEDVKFDTGSSLYSISAASLAKMGEQVIPALIVFFNLLNGEARIAIIDALGLSHAETAALFLESVIGKLTKKEFVHASLALSRCGRIGNTILKKRLYTAESDFDYIIVEALAHESANDKFLQKMLRMHNPVLISVLKGNSVGASLLIQRIKEGTNDWSLEDADILRSEGVRI